MKPTAAPERVNWLPVVAVFAALAVLIAAIALVIGFVHARNWLGVVGVIGAFLLVMRVGRFAELAGRRRTRRPQ